MALPKSRNVTWQEGQVSRADRERLIEQRGFTVWLTGLSGSGKTTIAVAAEKELIERGRLAYRLDGDNVRHGLASNLGFSHEDRSENIRRVGEVAKLFTDCGVIVFTSFISPYRTDRSEVRAMMAEGDFIEVYLAADVDICERRDVRGLYARARAGEIPDFTGISAPYERPAAPELVLDTARCSIEQCIAVLMSYLEEKGYLD